MTDAIQVPAHYSERGWLLIIAAVITVVTPLLTIMLIQYSGLRAQH